MITRMTKIQLLVFAIVTLIGGAFVGGRYAKIDRLVVDRTYPVSVQLKGSGGLFTGAQVTYRGIGVGRVGKMTFDGKGVKARLDIEKSAPKIPGDVEAVVANKSAVGEQFIDLRPRSDSAPYLKNGDLVSVSNSKIPLDTSTLLIDVNDLVKSVDTKDLKTVVDELGTAFKGTGEDLSRILDTTTSFIKTANDNIDVTRSLINDSSTVLQTQIDKRSDLATFSKNLALLSDTLVDADPDLRRLIDEGAPASKIIRKVIAENSKQLGVILNNVRTFNKPLSMNVAGLQGLLILYPYVIQGGYSVISPQDKPCTPRNGQTKDPNKKYCEYNAEFGVVLTMDPPVCTKGYTKRRPATVTTDRAQFPKDADCTPKNEVARNPSKTKIYPDTEPGQNNPEAKRLGYNRAPIGVYNEKTGTVTPTKPDAAPKTSSNFAGVPPLGKDSWKWLLIAPTTAK